MTDLNSGITGMMKEEDKEKSQENKSSDKPIEDQPQAQQPSEAGESAAKESTEDKLKEVSAKLMSDVSSVWGQALGEAGESLSCKKFLIAEMNQFFLYLNLLKPNILCAIVSFLTNPVQAFLFTLFYYKKTLKPFKAFGKTAIEKVEQNELVKQATVTVTDVAKKGAQYVENAPLIKDFNEEQKKFIRFENRWNFYSLIF